MVHDETLSFFTNPIFLLYNTVGDSTQIGEIFLVFVGEYRRSMFMLLYSDCVPFTESYFWKKHLLGPSDFIAMLSLIVIYKFPLIITGRLCAFLIHVLFIRSKKKSVAYYFLLTLKNRYYHIDYLYRNFAS